MLRPEIDENSLRTFLIAAKKAGYASAGEGGENQGDDGGKILPYSDPPLLYLDRYFGTNPFSGQEIVWQEGQPIWSMNYYGLVSDPGLSPGQVYAFLKQTLLLVDEDLPLRGPKTFTQTPFTYRNDCQGDLGRFKGSEIIELKGAEVYSLDYHGGWVA